MHGWGDAEIQGLWGEMVRRRGGERNAMWHEGWGCGDEGMKKSGYQEM